MIQNIDRKSMLEKKLSNLVNIMTNNLEILIKTRAVFVTISLIENTSYSENVPLFILKQIRSKIR